MTSHNWYFNYAGLALVPDHLKSHRRRAEEEFEKLLFSEAGVDQYFALLRDCRKAAARALGTSDLAGVSILPNASSGLNIAFRMLPLHPGKVLVSSNHEHPNGTMRLSDSGRKSKIACVGCPTSNAVVG
jgi:selenocysteine lyase/cysteine desulfurase